MAMDTKLDQGTTVTFTVTPQLRRWAETFISACKAEGKAPSTLKFYSHKITDFLKWAELRNIFTMEDVTADVVRQFMLWLEESGHNAGGRHAYYRTIRTFMYFWRDEDEPAAWRNPFTKAKPPKLEKDAPLEPVSLADVEKLLNACAGQFRERDKAILLTLLDTGLRATELTALDLQDVDAFTGAVLVRHGKGNKSRSVFLGQKSRRAVRAWLKIRGYAPGVLFTNDEGERLKYPGLRQIVRRLATRAHIKEPGLHSFRRAFALNCLRAGMDLLSLQRLMGHSDLSLLHRYAKQNTEDLRAAHAQASPVDRAGL